MRKSQIVSEPQDALHKRARKLPKRLAESFQGNELEKIFGKESTNELIVPDELPPELPNPNDNIATESDDGLLEHVPLDQG